MISQEAPHLRGFLHYRHTDDFGFAQSPVGFGSILLYNCGGIANTGAFDRLSHRFFLCFFVCLFVSVAERSRSHRWGGSIIVV